MNKKQINEYIDIAYRALKHCGIADENNKIEKTFRGHISTFGAAITMGSLLPAIAFFSDDGGALVKRTKLLNAIYYILNYDKYKNLSDEDAMREAANIDKGSLYIYTQNRLQNGNSEEMEKCKEDILNAAIALKLAMNLYVLEKDNTEKKDVDKNEV